MGQKTEVIVSVPAAGDYAIQLDVTVTPVGEPPPPPLPLPLSASAGPDRTAQAGETVTLTAQVAGGVPPFLITWEFGDGSTATGATVVHAWDEPDVYSVRLRVRDSSVPQQDVGDDVLVTVNQLPPPPPPPPQPTGDFIQLMSGDKIPRFSVPTIKSVVNGNWNDLSTWSLGRLPQSGDLVLNERVVNVNGSTAPVAAVENATAGRLTHSRVTNSNLRTGYLLNLGTLDMGSDTDPILGATARITILDVQPLDTDQYLTSLINLGAWTACGQTLTSWAELASPVLAGGLALQLKNPVAGWKVGDRIVVSGGHGLPSFLDGIEFATVAAVSTSGLTVTLVSPLQFDHLLGRDCVVSVANLRRNVIIESENPKGNRGHTMSVETGWHDLCHVSFEGLGRTRARALDPVTNHIGRYAAHSHCQEDAAASRTKIAGCVLWGKEPSDVKWPITLHNSRGVTVEDNVLLHCAGAGLFGEDEEANGNFVRRNLVIGVQRGELVGAADVRGLDGDGVSFIGTGNIVEDNLVCNASEGYQLWGALAAWPGAKHERNRASRVRSGLRLWQTTGVTIRDMRIGSCTGGQLLHYLARDTVIDGFFARAAKQNIGGDSEVGVYWGDYPVHGLTVRNHDLAGFGYGYIVPDRCSQDFTLAAYSTPNLFTMEDSIYDDNRDAGVVTQLIAAGSGGAHAVPPRKAVLRNVLFGSNQPVRIRRQWLPDGVHALVKDELYVYQHNGVATDNFRVYYREQAPGHKLTAGTFGGIGSPEPGLSNAQLAAKWEWRTVLVGGFPNSTQVRQKGTAGPPLPPSDPAAGIVVEATPWAPACACSELAPAGALDGTPFGIDGLVVRI